MKARADAYNRLRRLALSRGASLFGAADLDRVRSDTDLLNPDYDAYSRGLSVGVKLSETALADIVDGPTPEYRSEYLKVNVVLDSIAEALADEIISWGAGALRIPASLVVDWEKLRGHLPHKLIGRYAGHGWIGKSILLINPDLGARVRYVTVLTDLLLPASSPLQEGCGECARCVSVCPAHAVDDDPARFNLQACFSKLARFNERMGITDFICGMCIKACGGKRSDRRE